MLLAQISNPRFFRAPIAAGGHPFSVQVHASLIPASVGIPIAFIGYQILAVHVLRNISQIINSIVRAISIYVIYPVSRELAKVIEPRQGMREVSLTANLNADVALVIDATDSSSSGTADTSYQTAVRVVIDMLPKNIGSKIISSHEAVTSLIGQWRRGAINAPSPRHFMAPLVRLGDRYGGCSSLLGR